MSEVSHYGTRPLRCPPEAILHYASRDWPTDMMSACRGRLLHDVLAPGKEGGLVRLIRNLTHISENLG